VDLPKAYRQLERHYQAKIDQSQLLAGQHEFDAAVRVLRPLTELVGRRFEEFASTAKRSTEAYKASLDRAKKAAEDAQRQARDHLDSHDYEQAVHTLLGIPEPLRGDEALHLLSEVRAKRDLVRALNEEIRNAVRSGQLQGLTAKLERYLDLKPRDDQATRLARQLRDRLVRAAKKKVQEENYSAAVRLLDEVPTCALDATVQELDERARELDWLMTDLKLAAVVDSTLLALAKRLTTERPKNAEAARLYTKLKSRAAAAPASARHAAPDWAIPRTPHLGCPVDWLAGLQRISCSDEVTAQFRRYPSRYFAACGLALQGLERASVGINLLSTGPQRGVLGKMRLLRKRASLSAWGLDLGSSSLKAVHMHQAKGDGRLVIDACELTAYSAGGRSGESENARRPQWTRALTEFLSRHSVEGDRVCISLPGTFVLGRFFELPPIDKKLVEKAVRYEVAGQMPISLEELNWGYHVFEIPADEQSDSRQWRVVVQAVKRFHIQELLNICREIGLTADIVQSDCVALHNFAVFEHCGDASSRSGAVCILDVGAESSNLVISAPGCAWFRNFGLAGEAFTTALVRPLQLTRARAEQLKSDLSLAKRVTPVYELLHPVVSHLVDEVQRSLRAHSKLRPDLPVRRLIGCGGGFAQHGLLRRLRTGR
jgi:type IV pilus assembly protein PilM